MKATGTDRKRNESADAELAAPAITRRHLLQAGAATLAGAMTGAQLSAASLQEKKGVTDPENPPLPNASPQSPVTAHRIRQSACRWCYSGLSLEQLCAAGAAMGLAGIDLLQPAEYAIPRRYGMVCTMGYADAGEIQRGLNRVEHHAAIEAGLRRNLPLAQRAGVQRVITFAGLRDGISDAEGMRNTIIGLKRMKPLMEDHGIQLCLELLNSKVDHPGYMADHTAWGVAVVREVDSPQIRLLYDIYHMQIMEGDLITTIRGNIDCIGHFHTGGVPGRHELNRQQEVQWQGVMQAIAATSYSGYVAHEFIPLENPLASLRQAVRLCAV